MSLALLPAMLACVGDWVDVDTPSSACETRGRDGQPYTLVFSDEFNVDDRRFGDGFDARWTAIDNAPGGNAQVRERESHRERTIVDCLVLRRQ